MLNNQFMCMVQRILENKVHVGDTLQVDQDVSCTPECLLHRIPVNKDFPSDIAKLGRVRLKERRSMQHA